MSTTTETSAVRRDIDLGTLDRLVKTALGTALAAVLLAMLVVLVAGLGVSATLAVLFFAAVGGGIAGGRMAWKHRV